MIPVSHPYSRRVPQSSVRVWRLSPWPLEAARVPLIAQLPPRWLFALPQRVTGCHGHRAFSNANGRPWTADTALTFNYSISIVATARRSSLTSCLICKRVRCVPLCSLAVFHSPSGESQLKCIHWLTSEVDEIWSNQNQFSDFWNLNSVRLSSGVLHKCF